MKKHILFLLTLIYFFPNLYAQEWAPMGANWIYDVSVFILPPGTPEFEQWQVTSDSIIQGREVRKIERISDPVALNPISHYYTYEQNDTAYFYNEVLNQFEIWFDFTAEAGDTWANQLDTCTYHYTIDSVFTTVISDIELEIMLYTRESSSLIQMQGSIIKYIGDFGFVPDNLYECENFTIEGSNYESINCYEDSIVGHINFRQNPDCFSPNPISSITENDNSVESILLYPNPSSEKVYFEIPNLQNAQIQVYDKLGRRVMVPFKNSDNQYELDILEIPSGLYTVHIQSNHKQSFVGKFMKQE